MEVDILRTFVMLTKNKNFSKTAEMQNLVQSTVTNRIKELEKELGKQLFIRNKKKVELSTFGNVFLPYAQSAISLIDEGKNKVNTTDFYDGRLFIGSVDSIWRNLLSPVLKKYVITYPKISLKATTGHSIDIVQLLIDGIIDIAVTYQRPRLNKFNVYICHEDDFVFVVAPQHPLATRKSISIDELSNLNLLYHNWGGSFTRWITNLFPSDYIFKTEVDPAYIIADLTKEGKGPALLTRSLVLNDLKEHKLVEIPLTGLNLPPKWEVYLAFNSSKINKAPIKNWLKLMLESGMELNKT